MLKALYSVQRASRVRRAPGLRLRGPWGVYKFTAGRTDSPHLQLTSLLPTQLFSSSLVRLTDPLIPPTPTMPKYTIKQVQDEIFAAVKSKHLSL